MIKKIVSVFLLIFTSLPLSTMAQHSELYLGIGKFTNAQTYNKLPSRSPGFEMGVAGILKDEEENYKWDLYYDGSISYWNDFLKDDNPLPCKDCILYNQESFIASAHIGGEITLFNAIRLSLMPGLAYQLLRNEYHAGQSHESGSSPKDTFTEHRLLGKLMLDLKYGLGQQWAVYGRLSSSLPLFSSEQDVRYVPAKRYPSLSAGIRYRLSLGGVFK